MLLTFLLLAHTLVQSSEKVSDDSFAYLSRVTATNSCMKQIFVKLQDTLCDELTESDQSYVSPIFNFKLFHYLDRAGTGKLSPKKIRQADP
jgi:hypothetical protein